MSSSRRSYTLEFKQEAVQLVTKQGLSISEAARRLGIHANLLRNWRKSFEKNGTSLQPRQPTALEAENARLRAENERLHMERDILPLDRSTPRLRPALFFRGQRTSFSRRPSVLADLLYEFDHSQRSQHALLSSRQLLEAVDRW
jgi:transposase